MKTAILSGVLIALIIPSLASSRDDEQWNQWRGPNRDGTFVGETTWPDSVDESTLKLVWRKELGPSYSGPVVDGERVFVTETVDEKIERVTAFDRKSGEKQWSHEWEGSMKVPFFAASNGSWIRSTPIVDGDSVYVAGMRDYLVCLDAKTGAEKWKFDFVKQLQAELPAFGCACSPLIVDDVLYIQAGGGLIKLDKNTGKLIWRSLDDGGGMDGSAFSSPILANLCGVTQLVVQTRTELVGVDPGTGEKFWGVEIPAFRGMNIVTPTIVGDRVFTTTYGGKSLLFEIKNSGENWSVDSVWENRQQGYMSSPVIINDNFYVHLRNQRFTCIDLKTGESRWTSTPYGKYWSMVVQGDKILALDQDGELRLIKANPAELEIVSQRKIAEDSWAHLAVDGKQVLVRELNAIAVYSWGEE